MKMRNPNMHHTSIYISNPMTTRSLWKIIVSGSGVTSIHFKWLNVWRPWDHRGIFIVWRKILLNLTSTFILKSQICHSGVITVSFKCGWHLKKGGGGVGFFFEIFWKLHRDKIALISDLLFIFPVPFVTRSFSLSLFPSFALLPWSILLFTKPLLHFFLLCLEKLLT